MEPEIEKQSNLKRGNPAWTKGVSGNAGGRPKKEICITSWLKEYATQKIKSVTEIKTMVTQGKLTYAQMAAMMAWNKAAQGDLDEYEFIINRIEGKLKDSVDLTMRNDNVEDLTTAELMCIAARGSGKGNIAPSVSSVSSN